MHASQLIVASAVIVFVLGAAHLIFTFIGNRFHPRDAALLKSMQEISPVITRQTTMWRAWIGFNASHSYGAILFGVIYAYLGLRYPSFLLQDSFLLGLGWVVLVAYLVLAKVYWFRIPFRGISIAALLYSIAIIFILKNS
jgi:hypothetical protein